MALQGVALSLLARALEDGWSGLFWTMPEFCLALQSTYEQRAGRGGGADADQPATEWAILEQASEVDLLVLDDWGAEAQSPRRETWMSERLHVVLEERVKQGRPTVLTTNLASLARQISLVPRVP